MEEGKEICEKKMRKQRKCKLNGKGEGRKRYLGFKTENKKIQSTEEITQT